VGYPRSDMVLGLKGQRSTLGLGYRNMACVRTLYECLLVLVSMGEAWWEWDHLYITCPMVSTEKQASGNIIHNFGQLFN